MLKRNSFIATILALVLVMASALTLQAQPAWKLYRAYHVARQSVVVGKKAYILYDGTYDKRSLYSTYFSRLYSGNLAAWDLEENSLIRTYDRSNGLSDYRIAFIQYCKEAKTLVIVYDNGNIDLLDEDDNVTNLSHVMNATTLGAKTINDLCVEGSKAYISFASGIVVVDVSHRVIEEVYNLHGVVYSTAIGEDNYYLAMGDGIYSAPLTANLNDPAVLVKLPVSGTSYRLAYNEGYIYALRYGNIQCISVQDGKMVRVDPAISGNEMRDLVCQNGAVFAVTSSGLLDIDEEDPRYTTTKLFPCSEYALSASYDGKNVWMSNGVEGFTGYQIKDDALVPGAVQKVQIEGPARDLADRPHFVGERLLVAGGINTMEEFRNQETGYWYENGKWNILDEIGPRKAFPMQNHMNSLDLVQDPNDATHHYLSVCRNGLQEYKDGKFVRMFTSENSPLKSYLPDQLQPANYTFCSALQYDDYGTLWMANGYMDTIVRYIRPDGKWGKIFFNDISGCPMINQFLFTSSGVVLMNCTWAPVNGIFAFTIDDKYRATRSRLQTSVVNQRGTAYDVYSFYCMAEDHDGRVWVGTDHGLFVINNPIELFSNDFHYEQIIVNRNDGSGTADYLLSGIPVTSITVDYANRKWIGTGNDGLYLISADGQEEIYHFQNTDEDVLMPSNAIQGVAVHPTSGEVMIATSNGLCSYMGDATKPAEELEYSNVLVYPNPVTPGYTGMVKVSGLTDAAEVKILSSSGQIVAYGTANGGMFTWNCCNKAGNRVASGIYHVVCSTSDGDAAVIARIVVMK